MPCWKGNPSIYTKIKLTEIKNIYWEGNRPMSFSERIFFKDLWTPELENGNEFRNARIIQ